MHEMDPVMLPLHWRQAVDDSDVPRSAFLDHPSLTGAAPSARFGHAHAAIGDRLFVFGGDGPGGMLNNAFVYDAGILSLPAEPHSQSRHSPAVPYPDLTVTRKETERVSDSGLSNGWCYYDLKSMSISLIAARVSLQCKTAGRRCQCLRRGRKMLCPR